MNVVAGKLAGASGEPTSGAHSARSHARRQRRRGAAARPTRLVAAVSALLLPVALGLPAIVATTAAAAPIGQGFNVNASDLRFILKQIKIAEAHVASATPANPCATLLGPGVDQIPNVGQGVELPWGLRTVDGSCNNLIAGQNNFGTSNQKFPRLVAPTFGAAETGDPDGPGPSGPVATSYAQTSGTVIDSQPRVISNLIVDQTVTNPAAVAAAGEGATAAPGEAFFIPNVAPDVGLSAPYNSWFTLFGQFFDHGLDLVNKGGAGSVFMPLKADDPLFDDGADNIAGNADDGPNFMVLTRATVGADREATNLTSPFVDQSQTYTSHPSHQAFLREYANDGAGDPQSTGALITGPGGGMANWAAVKAQALSLLGIALTDADVHSVPLLATDAYGRFTRGPNGFPQIVRTGNVLVEGNPSAPITTANAVRSGEAFLDDIAHHAAPVGDPDGQAGPLTSQPLAPDADPGTVDDNNPATYDDEMLNAHFIAGDGRVNENIGLTTVHHVFHSEHNRLVDESDAVAGVQDDATDLKTVIRTHIADSAAAGTTPLFTLADWQLPGGAWNGERIFQAARFVTEMEYQHLAFEEFIRKVQPMVNPFGEGGTGYNTGINPAIRAEFAHAVYRFGHSMLTESVDRIDTAGVPSNIPLLTAFLNPPSFMTGTQTPEQAAGNVVRGMTRQVGNELDEFVTEAVRNKLLGLPLDLPALNLARARDTGVPSLNAARRSFFAASNNSALTPYESWADLSFSLKHSESLVNFIAAYGTHGDITNQATMAGKRNAANAILYGAAGPDGQLADDPLTTTVDESADNPTGTIPADRESFLNSTDLWANAANGVTITGVDTIDLWVGGLAEKQMVFGGLLGPTFNYVFEAQMEDLQFGDRFYYLSRTAGLNMLTQLEGNSFAELIQRNTDVSGLPADSFSRPDLVFNTGALGTTGPILDDPATLEYNEATLLTRMPNGTIRYGGPAHVVFNGTTGNNRMWSSEGDDTIRGNEGADWMQGGDGNDNLIGGIGDDILTDLNGDDVLKGGDGNDTLSSGQGSGVDLNQGGLGNDFVLHGNDAAETFGGPGDDWILGGNGDDTVFGDDGDDWMEGGGGAFNLLQGDNGAPFQDDPNEPGHDVLIGTGGESDFDSEGGDDIMLLGAGIQRSEGMLGFDWTTHKGDPAAGDSDMDFTGLLPDAVATNRDRFDLVESLSGWNRNDILRGDSRLAADMVGNELTPAGIARVANLAGLLPTGATSFTGGNILIGGAGSDTIEGRGGDDIIDGDAYLNARISVRSATDANVEIDSVDNMAGVQARVLAGTINPGQLRIIREILTPANGASIDIAQFTGLQADYTVTTTGGTGVLGSAGSVTTVVDNVGLDGTDTLRNIEQLVFSDTVAPVAPVIGVATAGDTTATVNFTPPAGGVTGLTVRVVNAATNAQIGALLPAAADDTSLTVNDLTNGIAVRFQVQATNAVGTGPFSALSNPVTPVAPVRQGAPTIGTPVAGNASVTVTWLAPGPVTNAAPVTGYVVRTFVGASTTPLSTTTAGAVNSTVIAGLTNGTSYTFDVAAINSVGTGPASARSAAVSPRTTAGAPTIGTPTAGNASATVRWTAPASNGGSAITGYSVRAFAGTVLARTQAVVGNVGSVVVTGLTNTTAYTFDVAAVNAAGTGAISGRSVAVTPRTEFVAPTVTARTPASGARSVNQVGNLTATFSEAATGVSGTTFALRLGATVIPSVVSYNATTRVATLNPNATLLADRVYTATLSGIRDVAGNTMVATSWSFTTGPAPTLVTATPAGGATAVRRNSNVTARFSEAITGFNTTTVRITRVSNGAVVPATVSFNAAVRILTINPGVSLAANVQYRVTITGGTAAVRDGAGNPFVTRTWLFRTGTLL